MSGGDVDQWFHEIVKIVLFFVVQLLACAMRLYRKMCYRPHLLDVSGLVCFCDGLQHTCIGLHCHCHAESLNAQ